MGENMIIERPRLSGLLVLLIPFLAMAYMTATNEMNYSRNTEYRLPITGYDPRNLLTGHYIVFRYAWPENTPNHCIKGQECFACLTGDPLKPDIDFRSQDLPVCAAALSVGNYAFIGSNPPQPPGSLQRYHVSEYEGPVLDKLLREPNNRFEVGILIYPDHKGQIKNLYMNGETLDQIFD